MEAETGEWSEQEEWSRRKERIALLVDFKVPVGASPGYQSCTRV
jgi:hypothetical protein